MTNHSSLAKRFQNIRNQTLKIIKPLKIEDFVAQPTVEVSPPKWHLGHTTWFFENFILAKFSRNYQLFNKEFNFIFNSYYLSQGDKIFREKRGTLIRPETELILAYREYVEKALIELLDAERNLDQQFYKFFEIGLHHEQQHQELLLTDIKYIFASTPLLPTYLEGEINNTKPEQLNWLVVDEGLYEIGHQSSGFAFDNELGSHKVFLNAYQIANRLVSNGEYLEFIEAGGYQNFQYWQAEGFDWVKNEEVQHPAYWFKRDNKWFTFTLKGIKPIDLEQPVTHISFYEADAYARWKDARLPTEQEWEIAAMKYGDLEKSDRFVESENLHPSFSDNKNDFFGSCWSWTNSAYLPYPNYKKEEGALGEYNGKFMINQMVLRGGSCVTPKSHYRLTYRNFFHPNLRWQFTGIRLAK